MEEKRNNEAKNPSDDKWSKLKAYRRAKGLCYVCGEKWGREHQCKTSIQLHVVQEMIDCMYPSDSESEIDSAESSVNQAPKSQATLLSVAALHPDQPAPRSMKISVTIQGQKLQFLIDSGSSTCFLDEQCAARLVGKEKLQVSVHVTVAGGDTLSCVDYFPMLVWSSQGHEFTDEFRVLSLQSYDGIVGLDWLAKHNPMVTHWAEQ